MKRFDVVPQPILPPEETLGKGERWLKKSETCWAKDAFLAIGGWYRIFTPSEPDPDYATPGTVALAEFGPAQLTSAVVKRDSENNRYAMIRGKFRIPILNPDTRTVLEWKEDWFDTEKLLKILGSAPPAISQ